MLDEPGLSLDPDWRRALQPHLRAQASEGRTILVATHLLGEWEGQADRCLVLEDGQVDARSHRRSCAKPFRSRCRRPRSPRAAEGEPS